MFKIHVRKSKQEAWYIFRRYSDFYRLNERVGNHHGNLSPFWVSALERDSATVAESLSKSDTHYDSSLWPCMFKRAQAWFCGPSTLTWSMDPWLHNTGQDKVFNLAKILLFLQTNQFLYLWCLMSKICIHHKYTNGSGMLSTWPVVHKVCIGSIS